MLSLMLWPMSGEDCEDYTEIPTIPIYIQTIAKTATVIWKSDLHFFIVNYSPFHLHLNPTRRLLVLGMFLRGVCKVLALVFSAI